MVEKKEKKLIESSSLKSYNIICQKIKPKYDNLISIKPLKII